MLSLQARVVGDPLDAAPPNRCTHRQSDGPSGAQKQLLFNLKRAVVAAVHRVDAPLAGSERSGMCMQAGQRRDNRPGCVLRAPPSVKGEPLRTSQRPAAAAKSACWRFSSCIGAGAVVADHRRSSAARGSGQWTMPVDPPELAADGAGHVFSLRHQLDHGCSWPRKCAHILLWQHINFQGCRAWHVSSGASSELLFEPEH